MDAVASAAGIAKQWTARMRAQTHEQFLARFMQRGWLHGTREDRREQAAVDYGLLRGWLRRELSEVHFTPKGRKALSAS